RARSSIQSPVSVHRPPLGRDDANPSSHCTIRANRTFSHPPLAAPSPFPRMRIPRSRAIARPALPLSKPVRAFFHEVRPPRRASPFWHTSCIGATVLLSPREEGRMPQIFHRAFNTVSLVTIYGSVFLLALLGGALALFARSPYATGVGITREQPIPFSHAHHVNELGIDCRYCHTSVEDS